MHPLPLVRVAALPSLRRRKGHLLLGVRWLGCPRQVSTRVLEEADYVSFEGLPVPGWTGQCSSDDTATDDLMTLSQVQSFFTTMEHVHYADTQQLFEELCDCGVRKRSCTPIPGAFPRCGIQVLERSTVM